jgi:hypothetical protein
MATASSLDICAVYPAISVNIIAASFLSIWGEGIVKFTEYLECGTVFVSPSTHARVSIIGYIRIDIYLDMSGRD